MMLKKPSVGSVVAHENLAFVITGDRALLRVREYHGIQVVSPRLFVSTHLVDKGA